jgi:hypothetical protein
MMALCVLMNQRIEPSEAGEDHRRLARRVSGRPGGRSLIPILRREALEEIAKVFGDGPSLSKSCHHPYVCAI